MKNYGFNPELEKEHQSSEDWIFGATSIPSMFSIPEEERETYLPKGELQNIGTEKMDCATRSPLNVLETFFNYGYEKKLFKSENIQWLEEKGYVQNRQVVFSDRFTAIKSGTTPRGNSLKAPIDSIHRDGLIPKSMFPQVASFSEYYDVSRITSEMEELGQEFLRRFKINYEKVRKEDFEILYRYDPLCLAGYAWSTPVNGEYPKIEQYPNHAFMGIKTPLTFIFDNYIDTVDGDYIKKLAPDYGLLDYAYRVFVSEEKKNPDTVLSVWNILLKNGLKAFFVEWYRRYIALQDPTETPQSVVPPKEVETPTPKEETPRERLLEEAKSWLGRDASPRNLAPSELSCSEAISNIIHCAFPEFPVGITYTPNLETELRKSSLFKATLDLKAGNIILSPTGKGNGKIPFGHTGCILENGEIASNDSRNGLFKINYTIDSFVKRYRIQGGYPIYVYEAV